MKSEAQLRKEILDIVIAECDKNPSFRICQKLKTDAGKDYIVNRCIYLLTKDNAANVYECLPIIETELDEPFNY